MLFEAACVLLLRAGGWMESGGSLHPHSTAAAAATTTATATSPRHACAASNSIFEKHFDHQSPTDEQGLKPSVLASAAKAGLNPVLPPVN